MGTVTIGADTFTVYGTSALLATYANGSLTWSDAYDAAVAVSANKPKRAHVEATRLLDAQLWQGDPAVDGQAQAWPRSDVTDAYGDEVDDSTVPQFIIDATYELALAMMANVSVVAGTSVASNVQSVGAGAASVSFFSPKAGGRFPDRVMELVGFYLGTSDESSITAYGSFASGVDGASQFDTGSDDDDGYSRTGP